jgi:hypothetical protein
MTKLQAMLITAIFISGVIVSYNYGRLQSFNEVENNTRSEIATRYLQIIGNPKTQEEQCNFEKIVYNDCK